MAQTLVRLCYRESIYDILIKTSPPPQETDWYLVRTAEIDCVLHHSILNID